MTSLLNGLDISNDSEVFTSSFSFRLTRSARYYSNFVFHFIGIKGLARNIRTKREYGC